MFLRDKIGEAVLINGFENTGIFSSSSILTFKFCKRPVRPDFLASPSAAASIVSLLNQLIYGMRAAKNGNILRSSFDLGYPGVLCIVCSLRRGKHLALRSPVRSGLPATTCFELI
jgi:hypothetical protein